MKWFLFLIASLLGAQMVFAQTQTTTTTAEEVDAAPAPVKLTGKLQSISWSGRLHETQNAEGERFRNRFEYELGARTATGWGIAGNGRWETAYFGDSTKDKGGVKDPSVKLSHPIYKGERFETSGQLRQYYPISDGTTKPGIEGGPGVLRYHTAWYNISSYTVNSKWTVENVLGPRYVSQSRYEDEEMKFYTENWTEGIYKVSDKLSTGVGNFAQVSVPHNARTGVSNEIYPFVTYNPAEKFEIKAVLYVPVLSEGPIDGPSSVSTANMLGELSLKASL